MATQETLDSGSAADANRTLKAAHRAMWALGDYHTFATSTVWELGPVLMAFLMVTSVAVIVLNLVADVAHGWLDPRTRLAGNER